MTKEDLKEELQNILFMADINPAKAENIVNNYMIEVIESYTNYLEQPKEQQQRSEGECKECNEEVYEDSGYCLLHVNKNMER